MQGDRLWVLRKLCREAPNARFVFMSERGACAITRQNIVSRVAIWTQRLLLRPICGEAVEKLLDSLRRAVDYFDREAPMKGG
jgi:hypothetical protein